MIKYTTRDVAERMNVMGTSYKECVILKPLSMAHHLAELLVVRQMNATIAPELHCHGLC